MQDIWLGLDAVIAVLALVIGVLLHKWISDRKIGEAAARADAIIKDAERDATNRRKTADLEAKEAALKARTSLEEETRRRGREFQQIEQRIFGKEEELARKLDQLERRLNENVTKERDLIAREKASGEKESRLATALDEQRRKLETIAGLTAEEARRQLLATLEQEARREAQLLAMRLEEEARETANVKAREVLATTIQRLAPDYTVETAVSVVDLPSDDMKGRIIGREGRNIRALELHTGVDLIVDDTPEAVLISAYDPYRREIARRALQVLIADGRIHPARIEEVVEKVKKEMEQHLREEGEKACFEVGVHGLHPELVKLVGRMKFRTSYGQNCLQHSKEVAWLSGMMAAEIKADVKLAKRMGLLHDIGKALTHEQEGSHPELSLQVLTKYNESPAVINAALCGHENVEPETIEAILV
ncbi:MAG: ribonuclease Y, partial [Candidatus Rokuibacteriota bacterium]